MSNVIAFSNNSYRGISQSLNKKQGDIFHEIDQKNKLNLKYLNETKPKKIFFPHWSYMIPEKIFQKYECIIFHMTELPFGRGGSPLQNLIINGYSDTFITAIKCVKDLDAGPIYMKKPLSLDGNADEIFRRAKKIIENMIYLISKSDIHPYPQKGKATYFKRRKPEQSNIVNLSNLKEIYNYIRMLDHDLYPRSFIQAKNFIVEFSKPKLNKKYINVRAKIFLKDKNE